MQDIVHEKGKVYYSMGEVAEMFDVNPSLLRYWEKEFDVLKPHRNKKGNRLFTPQDVDNLKVIYHLLKEKKMKIEVARKYIKDNKKEVNRDALIVEKLMSIRSMLRQIKQDMLYGAADDDMAEDADGTGAADSGAATGTGKAAGMARTDGSDKTTGRGRQKAQKPDMTVDAAASDGGQGASADIAAEALGTDMELTITAILSEEAGGEKLPFREQMLFEITAPETDPPSLDSMIDSFLSKNYGSGTEDPQAPEYDPFAAFADGAGSDNGAAGDAQQETTPKPIVIEQTLF